VPGAVVEIAGEAASAKTQLCMQIAATTLLPREKGGAGAAVVFVTTEGAWHDRRFRQIAREVVKSAGCGLAGDADGGATSDVVVDLTSALAVVNALSITSEQQEGLFRGIEARCGETINGCNVGLVVVDSVTALFRTEFGHREDAPERAQALWTLAHSLRRIASRGICVIVVNQVSDVITGAAEGNITGQLTMADPMAGVSIDPRLASREVAPALGLGWSNAITTRILLSRTSLVHTPSSSIVRKLQIVFCPAAPQATTFFFVDADGVHGLPVSDLSSAPPSAAPSMEPQ
jgi:hypothetical protein